jgi:Cdc6-like AAA superfamily ATPase
MKVPYQPHLPTLTEKVVSEPTQWVEHIARGLDKRALARLLLEWTTHDLDLVRQTLKRMQKEKLDEIEIALQHFWQPVVLDRAYLTVLYEALTKQALSRRFGQIVSIAELGKLDPFYAVLMRDTQIASAFATKLDTIREQREKLAIGYDRWADIVSVRELKQKLIDEEFGLQIRTQKWSLTPVQKRRLDELQLQIVSLADQLSGVDEAGNRVWLEVESREVASMVRGEQLLDYYRQKQNWFVNFPSREMIMDEIREAMLSGKSTLITGATGTGKTVLAVQVARSMQKKRAEINWDSIDAAALSDELKNNPDYVHVLSGNANMTVGEIIAKIGIKTVDDGKGGKVMETSTQLGKILKAYSEGKIPIFDEIDLVPNDILMRTKHLATLSPWERYVPQENGGSEVWIRNNIQLATANLKGAHHPDREDLDPAIVRLYQWITAGYLTKDEAYDLALVTCLSSNGSMVGISSAEWEQGGFVTQIVEFMKQVENNYMWHQELWWGIDASDQYLSKAVMDIGIFTGLFAGWETNRRSGNKIRHFREYVTDNLFKFVTNQWYPLSDRKILIQMANKQGLIDDTHKQSILQRSPDLSDADWSRMITNGTSQLPAYDTSAIAVMTPYEIAQLDPYHVRKIDELQWSQYVQLSELSTILSQIEGDWLMETDHPIWTLAGALLNEITENKNFSEKNLDELVLTLEEIAHADDTAKKRYDALAVSILGQASLRRVQSQIDERIAARKPKKKSTWSGTLESLSAWPELDRIEAYRAWFKGMIEWTIDHEEGINGIIAVAKSMIADGSFRLSMCGGLPTGEYRLWEKTYGIVDAWNLLSKEDHEEDTQNIAMFDYINSPLRWIVYDPIRKAIDSTDTTKRPSTIATKIQPVLDVWAIPMHHTWENQFNNDFADVCTTLQTEKQLTENDALLAMMYLQGLYGDYRVWGRGCVRLYDDFREFDEKVIDDGNDCASLLLSVNRFLSPQFCGGLDARRDDPSV